MNYSRVYMVGMHYLQKYMAYMGIYSSTVSVLHGRQLNVIAEPWPRAKHI